MDSRLDVFANFVLRLSNEDAVKLYVDSNGVQWTMFWFLRRIGHKASWEKAWESMNDAAKGFNVVNPEMVCDLFAALCTLNLCVNLHLNVVAVD